MKRKSYWIIVGGLVFWLPVVLISVVSGLNANWTVLNITPLVSLALLASLSWIKNKRLPEWGWVLAGIYILGPAAMLIASSFARVQPSASLPDDRLWSIAFGFFPPMTLWMATMDGMILSVLTVTIVLLILARYRTTRHAYGSHNLGSSQRK